MSQIKKLINQKFLEGIDSTKFHVAQNGAIMAKDSSGSMVEFLKVNSDNKGVVLGKVISTKDEIDQLIADLAAEVSARQAGDVDAKAYADQKIADLVNGAPALLDTLKELADAIGNDENFAATIGTQIGQLNAALAGEIARAGAAEGALKQRLDAVEPKVNTLEGEMDEAQADIVALEGRMTTAESDISAAEGRLDALEPKVSTLETEMDEAQADISALEGRMSTAEGDINALEAEVDQERSDRQAADDLKYDKSGGEIFGNVYINGLSPAFSNRLIVKGKALFGTSVSPSVPGGAMVEIDPQGTILAKSAVYARSSVDGDPIVGVILDSNNGKVTMQKSGGLPADVTEASQATTKKYVDDQDTSKLAESKAYTDSKVGVESAARELEDSTFLKLDGSRSMTGSLTVVDNPFSPLPENVQVRDSNYLYTGTLSRGNITFANNENETIFRFTKGNDNDKDEIASDNGVNLFGEFNVMSSMNAPSPTANSHVANKQYVDAGDNAAKSYADAAVLVEKNRAEGAESDLQSAIDTEKGRVDAILLASNADKDSFAEIVSFINSVDLENDNALAAVVLDLQNADDAMEARLDIVEPKVTSLEGRMNTAEGDIDALESGKADKSYVDSQDFALQGEINALEVRMDSAETNITGLSSSKADLSYVNSQLASLQSNADDIEGFGQDIRDDLDAEIARAEAAEGALDGRLDTAESKISALEALSFHKEFKTVGASDLMHVDLLLKAKPKSVKIYVGRLALHEDHDFTVGENMGVTRIYWSNDFMYLAEEGIEEGMKLFFEYYC